MLSCFIKESKNSIPIELVLKQDYATWLQQQDADTQTYLQQLNFKAEANQFVNLFDKSNKLQKVVCIYSDDQYHNEIIATLPLSLAEQDYHLSNSLSPLVYAGWGMGAYQFTRYKKASRAAARLVLPQDGDWINHYVEAIYLIRDLINTPTNDMGPEELAAALKAIANEFNAEYNEIIGEDLVKQNFPAIYMVGKAGGQAPRLATLTWGNSKHPHIALVGKGVCFDSGGLDIKPSTGMRLMKKDMGGAANVLGLATLIMSLQLPVYLKVYIPAVENGIAANAMHPGDIMTMRNGKTVEIDNTDAEGRLILADAISYATENQQPDLLVSIATLTGAARVAVGTEISAYFSNNEKNVASINQSAEQMDDPVWQQPLYQPYKRSLKTPFADLSNTGYSMGGAITAALFLEEFIHEKPSWLHFDVMAYNNISRPAHPEGGEAMGIGALFQFIKQQYC